MHRWIVQLAGCTGSVHPLCTDKDLVFDPSLAGERIMEGREETGN